MADYWIKLYHEIIDDPKMATLPDRLWRRTIELFLLAGRLDPEKSGDLPDTKQLAWLLRVPTDDLDLDMHQLAMTGIIQKTASGWTIPNFKKRQQAATTTERVKQHRVRKQKQQYYENETDDVTGMKRIVTQRTETESETETETEDPPPPDKFEIIRGWLESLTGIPAMGQAAIKAIDELVELDITREDAEDGYQWYRERSGAVRYYSSLVGPIRTAKAKRMQLGPPLKKRDPTPVGIILPDGTITEATR